MKIRSAIAIAALAVGVGLFVTSVVLGLVGAEQFREFAQYGYHPDWSCMPLPGHPGPDGDIALARLALGLGALGLIPVAVTLFADRRPLVMVAALSLAGCCVIVIWLDWSVVHGIATCAPLAR